MSDKLYASSGAGREVLPFLSKLESLAGSAVRAAGKVAADLIVVYTATGAASQGLACLTCHVTLIVRVLNAWSQH